MAADLRVYLTGFMGAGKSTVGDLLADLLDCPCVDLDAAVEAVAGQTVGEIFEASGEAGFRRLEDAQLRRTERFDRCVVATGGGTPVAAANRLWMRAHGTIVWLDATFDRLRRRVENAAERPLWRDEPDARRLFDRRLQIYRDCDLAIEIGDRPPRELALEIADRLAAEGLR